LELDSGEVLPRFEVAYSTFGQLNARKSNAVLICHALSGDAQVAGYLQGDDPHDPRTKPGWWDHYVGPGKAVDTNRYFVICANVLGGCKGTTGPSSMNPDTGKPWGLDFPVVTIGDMVDVQRWLIDQLGIEKLLAVLGGSMGGMQALEWAVRYPERVHGVAPIATTASLSAQSLAFDAVGRNAIISDPHFRDGRYTEAGQTPARGLAIARMLGHITYLSEEAMHEKFGRRLRHGRELRFDFNSQFSVETYLDHQGDKFVERFDANSYLYLTRAMDYFDLGADRGGLAAALGRTTCRFLVMSFSSDWLFPSDQSQRIVRALTRAGRTASYIDIPSPYGHDAFLLPDTHQQRAVRGFLARLSEAVAPNEDNGMIETWSPDASRRRRLDLERIDELIDHRGSILDLGCGDGDYLARLCGRGCQRAQGVDIDVEQVIAAVERGVDVIHADLDQPLDYFQDKAFDTVILSRTLQVVIRPAVVLQEMLRVGERGIVTFPNFGYWRNRHQIALTGRVPVTRNLPFSWAETPNIHHLSMRDFEAWCAENDVSIEQVIALDYESLNRIRWLPQLRATDAIYVISR